MSQSTKNVGENLAHAALGTVVGTSGCSDKAGQLGWAVLVALCSFLVTQGAKFLLDLLRARLRCKDTNQDATK